MFALKVTVTLTFDKIVRGHLLVMPNLAT